MGLFLGGFALIGMAVALIFVVLAPPKVAAERRRPGSERKAADGTPVLTTTSNFLVSQTDRYLRSASWAPVTAHDLELAGMAATPGSVVVSVLAVSATLLLLALLVTGSLIAGILFALLVPIGAKVALMVAIERRQKAFTDQLDETLQILASALRAGHSFPAALDAVAQESESPTAEEFTRIINENRIGRDLIVALTQTADRMKSEDFRWVAEAVAVHRDTGGNLNEVLDRVGATMRERNQIRQQVHTLAAEGRFSAVILMLLPVVVGGVYALINPEYMSALVDTGIGRTLLAFSFGLYVIGGLWMRVIVNVKF